MSSKSPPFEIAEVSGDRYPDLETAQRLALESMARYLAGTLHGLLATGKLKKQDRHITIPPSENGDTKHG